MNQRAAQIIDLRREEIEEARRLSESQKLLLGGDLFDAACEVMLSGIRAETPGMSNDAVLDELRRRLDLARRLESRS